MLQILSKFVRELEILLIDDVMVPAKLVAHGAIDARKGINDVSCSSIFLKSEPVAM